MIIQSQRCRINQGTPCRDIAFMVAEGDSSQAEAILQPLIKDWLDAAIVVNKAIAKVSIVGSGMIGHPGVAAHFFAALAQENINIEMIATSEIKISCVVPQDRGVDALKAAHSAFNLAGTKTVTVPA
jgi:aspartate kinase